MKIAVPVALSVSLGEPKQVPDGYVQFPTASHNVAQIRIGQVLALIERVESEARHELAKAVHEIADLMHLR